MSRSARIAVEIKTRTGTFRRVSEPKAYASNIATVRQGVLAYPDIRCTKITIYVSTGGQWREHSTHRTQKAAVNNLAFAILDQDAPYYLAGNKIDLTVMPDAAPSATKEQFDAWNAELDHDANRVVYSEATKPREFRAQSVVYSGNGRNDRIMGFGANTEAISEGQFGQYPVYIFCRHSIFPLGVTTAGSFQPDEPISTTIGAIGRYAIASVEKLLAFASDDGIYLLAGELRRISDPLDSHFGGHSEIFDGREPYWARYGLRERLGPDVALGYLSNRDLNVRELWCATADGLYCYSLGHARWFTVSERQRRHFFSMLKEPTLTVNPPRLLYGVGTDGKVYEESGRIDTSGAFYDGPYGEQVFVLETSRLGLGFPDYRKRVPRMGIRQRNMVCELDWFLLEPREQFDDSCPIDLRAIVCSDEVPENWGRLVVRSGRLCRGKDRDVFSTGFTKARNPILRIEGRGYPHQAIESFMFWVRPIFVDRLEVGNYEQMSPDLITN